MSARNGNPKMQRAHFQLIADVVYDAELSDSQRNQLAHEFARRLRSCNENFDEDKFIGACTDDRTVDQ